MVGITTTVLSAPSSVFLIWATCLLLIFLSKKIQREVERIRTVPHRYKSWHGMLNLPGWTTLNWNVMDKMKITPSISFNRAITFISIIVITKWSVRHLVDHLRKNQYWSMRQRTTTSRQRRAVDHRLGSTRFWGRRRRRDVSRMRVFVQSSCVLQCLEALCNPHGMDSALRLQKPFIPLGSANR